MIIIRLNRAYVSPCGSRAGRKLKRLMNLYICKSVLKQYYLVAIFSVIVIFGWFCGNWFRCQLCGRTQLTNSETLFVALPLRLFASLQPTHTLHQPPLQFPRPCPCAPAAGCLLWQKFIPQAFELHFITARTPATGTASGLVGGATFYMGLRNANGVGAILKARQNSAAKAVPVPPFSPIFHPPISIARICSRSVSLLWFSGGFSGGSAGAGKPPNEAYKWPLSQLELGGRYKHHPLGCILYWQIFSWQ